ncbi:MAG TPA: cache domain-containing protein, partial [Brevundimonas sp.]|nr:cache domain-containing protein [Brevundimonas sp.]
MKLPGRVQRLLSFRNLRTRLTLLYMGLFALALILSAIAVVTAVTNSARHMVRDEMSSAGAVYGQLWEARSAQLRQGAGVLAQDYGFREAVATDDAPTVRSALDNLRARQGVDGALILGVDGHATSTGVNLDEAALDALFKG